MERTDRVTKIAGVLIFLALAAYLGFYLYNALTDTVQTALVVSDTVLDTVSVSGIIVRDEQVVACDAKYVSLLVSDGEKVAANEAIAQALDSEAALERSNRQRELELEIERMETLLSSMDTADDLTGREAAIKAAVLGLSGAVAAHDLSDLDSLCLALGSLVFDNAQIAVTRQELDELKLELSGMSNVSAPDAYTVTAGEAGIFSTVLDGFEYLALDDMEYCTPDRLRQYMQEEEAVAGDAVGKLVRSQSWYFAVTMAEQEAEALSPGDRVRLDFGRYYSGDLSARLYLKAMPVSGLQVVVFVCSDALAETLALRQVSAELITAEYTGLRVPAGAVYTGEDGQRYVYTMTGLQAERKEVEVVYEGDGYYLVRASGAASALRVGNEVILTDRELHDGMVMN